MNYTIRKIKPSELYLLEDFLYEAIFQKDETNLFPRDIIHQPNMQVYIQDFGKPDDYCLVAEVEGEIIGAVWTRILSGDVKGYGNIDDQTPEFAISIYKGYRSCGIGTALMKRMLGILKEQGYQRTSLSVQKDNTAYFLYKKVGFEIVDEFDEDYLMVCHLNKPHK